MAEAAGAVAQQLVDEQLAADSPSPLTEIRDGVSAFLDVCVGGDFQRIVLVDGPRVLGTDAWESLVDTYGRQLLEEWLDHCVEAGDLAPIPTKPLARLLIAMLTEASLAIPRSDDPAATRAEFGVVMDRMLTGLAPRSPEVQRDPLGPAWYRYPVEIGGDHDFSAERGSRLFRDPLSLTGVITLREVGQDEQADA